MSLLTFYSLLQLMVVGCVTPGPNNALLSASGMNFGYRATAPHFLGVMFGHAFMEFSVALGAGAIYTEFPIFREILRIVAIVLLIWLAWKIASAPVEKLATAQTGAKPWTFWQAFIFQWINPKAWLIAIAVSGQFAGGANPLLSAFYIFLATLIGGIVSTQLWTGFGVAMARVLNTPTKRRIFNFALAGLLIFTIVLMLGSDHATV